MVKIFITQQAKEDLKNIKVYIQKDSYQNSIKVLQTLVEKIKILEKYPEIGKVIARTSSGPLRQIMVYSYRIIYRIENNNVQVLTVYHSARLLSNNPGIGEYFED